MGSAIIISIWSMFLLLQYILYGIYFLFEFYKFFKMLYNSELNKKIKASICYESFLEFFKGLNYLQLTSLVLFGLTVTFIVFVFAKSFCVDLPDWQLGVTVVWLSWMELILISTQFNFIGVYAIMFTKVFKTLLKLIPLASMLIFGFGLTFHFLFLKAKIEKV